MGGVELLSESTVGRQTNKGGGGGNYKNDSMEISKQPKPMKPIRSGLPLPRIRVVLARIKKEKSWGFPIC